MSKATALSGQPCTRPTPLLERQPPFFPILLRWLMCVSGFAAPGLNCMNACYRGHLGTGCTVLLCEGGVFVLRWCVESLPAVEGGGWSLGSAHAYRHRPRPLSEGCPTEAACAQLPICLLSGSPRISAHPDFLSLHCPAHPRSGAPPTADAQRPPPTLATPFLLCPPQTPFLLLIAGWCPPSPDHRAAPGACACPAHGGLCQRGRSTRTGAHLLHRRHVGLVAAAMARQGLRLVRRAAGADVRRAIRGPDGGAERDRQQNAVLAPSL